jgi:hypothetical protein
MVPGARDSPSMDVRPGLEFFIFFKEGPVNRPVDEDTYKNFDQVHSRV